MKSPTALVAAALAFATRGVAGFPDASGCTPQGPGNCNFSLQGLAPNGDIQYQSLVQAALYDYQCNVIGGIDTRPGYFHFNTWYTLYSQLPWTVNFHLYNGNGNAFYMEYAGYSYGGDFACRMENNNWHVCQHAFPC